MNGTELLVDDVTLVLEAGAFCDSLGRRVVRQGDCDHAAKTVNPDSLMLIISSASKSSMKVVACDSNVAG
jgi:hypothetical protein